MTRLRYAVPALGLGALLLGGCFITQAQIFAHFALPNPFAINSATDPFERIAVNLNTVQEYADHKDKLEGLSDFAIVGTFTNVAGPAGAVEVWITPGTTSYATVDQVQANATRLWGPASIGAAGSASATHVIGWDESAELVNPAGRKIVIDQAKGDGTFTLYTFGTAGIYDIRVDGGQLILTISGGV